MNDLLDFPRQGVCPNCCSILEPSEYKYDNDGVKLLDGPGNYWCPVCGYEDDE